MENKFKKKIKKQWVITVKETASFIGGIWANRTETLLYKAGKDYYVFCFYPEGSYFVNCTEKILELKKEGKW